MRCFYRSSFGVCLFLIFTASYAWAADYDEDAMIPGFTEISPGIYRGGQPTEEGYRYLKEKGIKTIVNFRDEAKFDKMDRAAAQQLGMDYFNIPWVIYKSPREEVVREFSEIIRDDTKKPIFFHCRRGVERTGVMTYAYAREFENMSHDEAYQKAFEGFPLKFIWKPFVHRHLDFIQEKIQEA